MMRILSWRKSVAALAAGLILTGCSGGEDAPSTQLEIFYALRDRVKEGRGDDPGTPSLTRAQLDSFRGAFLEVTRENNGQYAYLAKNLERRDDEPGRIVNWRTRDDITITTRNGVLIATRGVGGDLMSASTLVSGDRPGPVLSGPRTLQIRALDNKEVAIAMACEIRDLGPETIEIVEWRHSTRHIQEACSGSGGTVVNDYWVGNGLVWQSRQWAGPHIGYLKIRQLTR